MSATALAVLIAIAVPVDALASRTIAGRIAAYSPTSLSVVDKEVVTFTMDARTVFTKLVTQRPWQADTALDSSALRVGRYAVVHPRDDAGGIAGWIQIATDMPVPVPAVRDPVDVDLASTAEAYISIAALVNVLPASELTELVLGAQTSVDHLRLAQCFGAIAVKNDAAAYEHLAAAAAYRRSPTAAESKRPGSPGTAVHCERLAVAARDAGDVARTRAERHERLAEEK